MSQPPEPFVARRAHVDARIQLISCHGELDLEGAAVFEAAVDGSRAEHLVIDLSGVRRAGVRAATGPRRPPAAGAYPGARA